ncbi:MAG: hypothetical protein E6L03_01250 [Thaumarchaeota archaeon]|nr:MAG: hypothetical protein E6L03_01250 [Nitrososphaerota archaeon]TLX85765.1 MAG: hypothetical protein E6L01_05600 [Nitrososphaerota archaeon]
MFSTSSLYFLVAIFGESIESSEAHGLQLVEGQENTNESNKRLLKETGEILHQEISENQCRVLEFPLSIIAGMGYAAIGLWMILDRRNSKVPYIIAIVGSLVLLGIYFTSRTVGISSLGTEPIGLLDAIVAGLQVAIIAISLYILLNKIYAKGMTVG